ncbi:hypothetical protein J4Q44_G00349370 [Coregonus suidteri]|uniref:Uncharacterized protein n=1 Tax=Coregonus suidteri TaxID=861788 RepID=A0AAN8KKD7_9TELE
MSVTSMTSDHSMDSPLYFKEREKLSQLKAGTRPGEPCDICSERKAMKLCLTCSVYYCEKHVRKHFIIEALRRHVTVDVTEELVLQRNTSEKKRREEQEEGRRQRQEEGLRRQTRKEDIREEERGHQEAAEQQRIERERERESEREQQQQSMGDSYGSTGKVQPEISMADRAKSKSTAELDHVEKPEIKVTSSDRLGEASWIKGQQSLPQAALERQQIPQEIKKTRLRPDNSWIRQRSTSKHPAAGPIRRGKSLDNLDIARCSSWRSSWTPESPSSIPSYSWPHSGLSGLNTYSGGVRGHSRLSHYALLSLHELPQRSRGWKQPVFLVPVLSLSLTLTLLPQPFYWPQV